MNQRINIQFYIKRDSLFKKLAKRLFEGLIIIVSFLCLLSVLLYIVQEMQAIRFTKAHRLHQSISFITKPKELKMIESLPDTITTQALPTIESRTDTIKHNSEADISNQKVASIHIVEENETLYRISVNNKVSVERIKTINHLTNNIITIGMKLKIPEKLTIEE
jgi:LysM repeat protein